MTFLTDHDWAIYAAAFFGPFVQEDAAILAAASAGTSKHANAVAMFFTLLAGLTISDAWKYWIGRFAHRWPWASVWLADPRVSAARERVLDRLLLTLLAARFVPGTRIPLYIACGVFKAPFWRFLVLIIFTGAVYCGMAFTLFVTLGAVVGEKVRGYIPFAVLGVIAVVLLAGWLRHRFRNKA